MKRLLATLALALILAAAAAAQTTPAAPAPNVTVSAFVTKSGLLVAFGACGATPAASGNLPLAPIAAVNAAPTVYVNGNAVALGPPIWTSGAKDMPLVFYRLQCGAVRNVEVTAGGAGYTGKARVVWAGDGGGSGVVCGSPTIVNGVITAVPVAYSAADFTAPPTLTVVDPAATTPAAVRPTMAGAAPSDVVTYDAPANFVSPVLGGSANWINWQHGSVQPVPAVAGAAADNWSGRLEGASGGFRTFAQTPAIDAGVNVGSQPTSPGSLSNTVKNRARLGTWQAGGLKDPTNPGSWQQSGSTLTLAPDGVTPATWTNPAKAVLRNWCHGPLGTGPLGQQWPGIPGRWTLRWDDPGAGTPQAAKVWLTASQPCTLVSAATAGRTTTAVYDVEYRPGATARALNVAVNVTIPGGRWTISNLKVVAPDARDGSAAPIAAGEDDFEPDPNAVVGLQGIASTRWMDATQNWAGNSNLINAADLPDPTAANWNPQAKLAARAVAARYLNTDPASTTYPWSSTQVVGPQAMFGPTGAIALPATDNGQFVGGGAAPYSGGAQDGLTIELRFAQPHPFTTGQTVQVWVEAGGVAVPSDGGGSPVIPTALHGGPAFVTSPTTLAFSYYNPIKLPWGPQPQRVASAAEIDLTAGGTKPGWSVFCSVPAGAQNVPYRYTARFAARMPDSTLWVNLPAAGTDALVRRIAGDVAAELDPSNRVFLELSNEVWNGTGGSQQYFRPANMLLAYVPAKTSPLDGFVPTGTPSPGDFYGSYTPIAAHAYNVFTAAAKQAGIDPSRIETVYGGWYAGPYRTKAIMAAATACGARVDHVAIAPYHDIPADPAFVAAFSPKDGRLPVDGIIDVIRHWMAYSAVNQSYWSGHSAAIAAAGSKATLVCYEGGIETPIPSAVPNSVALTHDVWAHPAAADLVYCWLLACQQGDQAVAGSGAVQANYYQAYQAPYTWTLAQGPGQVPGDGRANQFATFQGGRPADGKDHNGGPGANVSPGLYGIRLWGAAVKAARQQPTPTPTPPTPATSWRLPASAPMRKAA